MAKRKERLTEGKKNSITSLIENMILKLQRTFKMN